MIGWFTILAIPTSLFVLWFMGSVSLSHGGLKLVRLGTKSLLIYGGILLASIWLLEIGSFTPHWIAGSEGYGIILPIISGFVALTIGLITYVLNLVLLPKIAEKNNP